MRTLLIGGARSGKSALALRWATERSTNVCTVVTGTESDPEMAARIAAHRRERPTHWRVREEPVHLGKALREEGTAHEPATPSELVLVDCLTLWISNCLWPPPAVAGDAALQPSHPPGPSGPDDSAWARQRADFLDALSACTTDVIIVTNEVGTGIVPTNAAARIFRDEQGWLNQAVAAICDEVFFVTAGLPLRLKPTAEK
jgi:adenosylcobinamide kinase/adenosylcobinamide-phosphate guanylyltransferase